MNFKALNPKSIFFKRISSYNLYVLQEYFCVYDDLVREKRLKNLKKWYCFFENNGGSKYDFIEFNKKRLLTFNIINKILSTLIIISWIVELVFLVIFKYDYDFYRFLFAYTSLAIAWVLLYRTIFRNRVMSNLNKINLFLSDLNNLKTLMNIPDDDEEGFKTLYSRIFDIELHNFHVHENEINKPYTLFLGAECSQALIEKLKPLFRQEEEIALRNLIINNIEPERPLLFKGLGNQLVYIFLKLDEVGLIKITAKTNLQEWILKNFHYLKNYKVESEFKSSVLKKYVEDEFSIAQNPLFKIQNIEGKILFK